MMDRSGRGVWLAVAAGLGLRVLAAVAVWVVTSQQGKLCLFDDTAIYWDLAGRIVEGRPYVVFQEGGIPHYALRAPGYPVFLAAVRWVFGSSTLAPRLAQAVLGAAGVALVAELSKRVAPEGERARVASAWVAALEPYSAAMSALLLSEAVFVPLMLVALVGLARLWNGESGGRLRAVMVALGTGAAAGVGVLTRPSWALFVPAALGAWVVLARGRRKAALGRAGLVGLGLVLAMSPWWIRNERVLGKFVPTALWMGASLYDGLSPEADGSSDMDFLHAPEFRDLDEATQDAKLRERAWTWARAHPARVLELAVVKFGRFWSPWPNAEEFSTRWGAVASALVVVPLYGVILLGAWDHRGDMRGLVLTLGPVLYFLGVHLVFVSSIRYRIPALVPAFALAGEAVARRWPGRGVSV